MVTRSMPFTLLTSIAVWLTGCSTSLEPDAERDPCVAAVPIAVGASMSGQLGSGDCMQADGIHGDRWALELSRTTPLQIDLTSSSFDPLLELRDRAGQMIVWNDDYQSLNSRIIHTLPAGSYVIVARSYAPGMQGSYRLTVAEGPDCSPVGELALGSPVSGSMSSDDCIFDYFTVDNWTLELSTARRLRIDLESPDFEEVLLIRDERGTVWSYADHYGHPEGRARIEVELPAGTWTVSAGGTTTAGAYALTADIAPPCSPGTELRAGDDASGDISSDDCLFEGWTPADSFAVVVENESAIGIHLKSSDFAPFMVLRDPEGRDVAVGWNDMRIGDARIRSSLDAGTYALYVMSNDWPPTGSYQVSVSAIECSVAGPVTVGETVSGELAGDDCLRPGGVFQDVWELNVTADGTVRIDLTSAHFDAFLTLEDEAGNVIATDDDGGSGLNARLESALTAGAYRISASSYGRDQIGAYDLATSDVTPMATTAAQHPEPFSISSGAMVKSSPEAPGTVLARIRAEWERTVGGGLRAMPESGGKDWRR